MHTEELLYVTKRHLGIKLTEDVIDGTHNTQGEEKCMQDFGRENL